MLAPATARTARAWYWLLILLFGASVLPFFLLGFYAMPGSADYWAASGTPPIVVDHVNGLVVIHPGLLWIIPLKLFHLVGWPWWHGLLAPSLLALWGLACWSLLWRVTMPTRRSSAMLAGIIALALWLTHWPALGEGLFQAADAWASQLGPLCLVVVFVLLMLPAPARGVRLVAWGLVAGSLCVGAAGSSLAMAVITTGLLGLGTLLAWRARTPKLQLWLLLLVCALLGAGGVGRLWQLHHSSSFAWTGGLSVWQSLQCAGLGTLLLIMQWGGDLGWWLGLLILLPVGGQIGRRVPALMRVPMGWLIGSTLALPVILLLALTVTFYDYGPRLPRSATNGCCLGMALGIGSLVLLMIARGARPRRLVWGRHTWRGLLVLLALNLLLVGPQSGMVAWQKIAHDVPAYRIALSERQALLAAAKASGAHVVTLPRLPPEPWLGEADISADDNEWANIALAKIFGLDRVLLGNMSPATAAAPAPPPAPTPPPPPASPP